MVEYEASKLPTSGFYIDTLRVVRLFDQFSYDLKLGNSSSIENNKLIILYGDNGSGKTTILNLVFHLLSSDTTRGHRTFLARTPFSEFSVRFVNGFEIRSYRDDDNLIGSFRMEINTPEGDTKKLHLVANEQNSIKMPRGKGAKNYQEFFENIAKFNIGVHLLSDSRKVWGDIYAEEKEEAIRYRDDYEDLLIPYRRRERKKELSIEKAISSLWEWIRKQTLEGSSAGAATANTIYAEVVRQIANIPINENEKKSQQSIDELISTMTYLSKRSEEFSRFGLASRMDVDELTNLVIQAPDDTRPIINNVLRPYLDGTEARLDALEDLKNLIAVFVNHLNEFYMNKQIRFNLHRGLTIEGPHGKKLQPNALSSGEQQLLLLFCTTISAQDRASIIIIDEPEISLNVKWQRNLIQALLDCIRSDTVQFLLATHSLELLAQHRQNVIKLVID